MKSEDVFSASDPPSMRTTGVGTDLTGRLNNSGAQVTSGGEVVRWTQRLTVAE